jgi:hypothetical protein
MNNDLLYQGSDLVLDHLPLADVAREFGTPVYVYSASSIRRQAARLMESLGATDRSAMPSRPTRTLHSLRSSSAWAWVPTR